MILISMLKLYHIKWLERHLAKPPRKVSKVKWRNGMRQWTVCGLIMGTDGTVNLRVVLKALLANRCSLELPRSYRY